MQDLCIKPPFLYNKDGSLREFHIDMQKTILPVWLLSIMVAIMCYLAVLYYVAYPKIWNLQYKHYITSVI